MKEKNPSWGSDGSGRKRPLDEIIELVDRAILEREGIECWARDDLWGTAQGIRAHRTIEDSAFERARDDAHELRIAGWTPGQWGRNIRFQTLEDLLHDRRVRSSAFFHKNSPILPECILRSLCGLSKKVHPATLGGAGCMGLSVC
jgi:hypothetical protein